MITLLYRKKEEKGIDWPASSADTPNSRFWNGVVSELNNSV